MHLPAYVILMAPPPSWDRSCDPPPPAGAHSCHMARGDIDRHLVHLHVRARMGEGSLCVASDLSGGSSAAGGARAVPPAARECRGARASSLTLERFSSLLQSTAVYCSLLQSTAVYSSLQQYSRVFANLSRFCAVNSSMAKRTILE